MIVQTLNSREAWDQARKALKNSFSAAGFDTLFEYLESISEESGQDMEFDPIAWRCEFQEMRVKDAMNAYEHGLDYEDYEDYKIAFLEWLQNETLVLSVDDETIILQDF